LNHVRFDGMSVLKSHLLTRADSLGVIGVYAGTVGRAYANDAPAASKTDLL
jgi:hypothetical protein